MRGVAPAPSMMALCEGGEGGGGKKERERESERERRRGGREEGGREGRERKGCIVHARNDRFFHFLLTQHSPGWSCLGCPRPQYPLPRSSLLVCDLSQTDHVPPSHRCHYAHHLCQERMMMVCE